MGALKYILFYLIVFGSTAYYSQTVVSSCSGADSIYWKYKKSADKLAILRCQKIGDTYKDSVVINKQISTLYQRALTAVYNATALPARDTIVYFNITLDYKYWPYSALNSLIVEADSTKSWISNLRQNIIPCGQPQIDNLISKHYLKVTGSSIIWPPSQFNPFNCKISFRTDTNCYTNRLCDKFNALSQLNVGNASPQSTFSDNFNITDSVNTNFTELIYTIGWGDCTVGCLFYRSWKFRVNLDCSVEYLGSYGDPIPPNFFTGLEEQYGSIKTEIYPNPAKDFIYFKSETSIKPVFDFQLIKTDGSIICNISQFNALSEAFPVSHLENGLYFLKITQGAKSFVQKLIIQKD